MLRRPHLAGVLIGLAVTVLFASGVARADTITFGAQTASPFQLSSVACESATTCLAVGTEQTGTSGATNGEILPIVNGVPGTPTQISPPSGASGSYYLEPTDITCPTASTCEVVGEYESGATNDAMVVTVTNGSPGTPRLASGAANFNGISCWDADDCLAVGSVAGAAGGAHALVTGGVPGAVSDDDAEAAQYVGVDCSGAGQCGALGSDTTDNVSVLVPIVDDAADSAESLDGGQQPSGFACFETSSCLAIGSGDFRTYDGALGPLVAFPDNDIAGACPSSSACLLAGAAVPNGGAALTAVDSGVVGSSATDASLVTFDTLACETATTCVAVGNDQNGQQYVLPVTFAASPPSTSGGTTPGGTTPGGAPTPAPAPAPAASASVGRATQRKGVASVPVSCAGASCTVTLTETIHEKVRHGHRTKTQTVVIARHTATLAAGAHASESLTLNSAGRRALARAKGGRLKATVTTTLGGRTVGHATLTLTRATPRKAKRHRR